MPTINFSDHDQEKVCKYVLTLDDHIRFAGIIDEKGTLIHYEYRKDVTPLISDQDLSVSALQALIRHGTRQTFDHKTGKVKYSVTVYEKVKRATIPLNDFYLLLVSFDIGADHQEIIVGKILSAIDKPLA